MEQRYRQQIIVTIGMVAVAVFVIVMMSLSRGCSEVRAGQRDLDRMLRVRI